MSLFFSITSLKIEPVEQRPHRRFHGGGHERPHGVFLSGKRERAPKPRRKTCGPEKDGLASDLEDLPEKFYASRKEAPQQMEIEKGYETLVSEFEKALILQALNETKGVKSKAAQILSMNRTTLIEKMKRLGLD